MGNKSVADGSPVTAQMYRDHVEAICRYVRRRVPEWDVDDVVSEVFFVLARGKPIPPDAAPLPWLYGVAFRVVQKHHSRTGLSRRLRQRLELLPPPPAAPDPADQVSAATWLDDVLGRLKTEDAELLRLVVFEDLTVAAAAMVLGISTGSAHTRLHRIRRKVQPWFESHRRPAGAVEPTSIRKDHDDPNP